MKFSEDTVTVRIPSELKKWLTAFAAELGLSLSDVCRMAFENLQIAEDGITVKPAARRRR